MTVCEVVSIAPTSTPFSAALGEVMLEALAVRLRAPAPLLVNELEALCQIAGVSASEVAGCAEERAATA